MRTALTTLCLMLIGSALHGYQYWNDIRCSALLPDSSVTVRMENPSGAGVENYLLHAGGGIQEELMALIQDGPSTLSATVPGPASTMRYYGFRLIHDGELDFMPVRIGTGATPQPDDLTRVAVDAAGDELFGYVNLDLTDCRVSFSDERLYAALRNAGGGFPVIQGLTFFGYLLGIANPAQADPDTVWGLMYTLEQAGIISPGLYRIEGTGFSDLIKIGEVEVQEFPTDSTLMISCLLADLMADPYFTEWYDTTDPAIGVAAFTQRITLLGGAAEADRSPGGRCSLRDYSISPAVNLLPELSNADFQGSGAEAFAEIEYYDTDGNCPVLAEIVFDEEDSFPLFPMTLDYDLPIVYRTDAGIAPLAGSSWSSAVFRFSDNQEYVVEHAVYVTAVEGDGGLAEKDAISISNIPNPFNAVTVIKIDLPRTLHVNLSVYDVRGVLVANILDQRMTEGPHEIIWRAKNERGEAVAAGIYFYRLVAGDFVQTRKMVLLR